MSAQHVDEWLSARHLAGLAGLPTTVQGVWSRAQQEGWARRRSSGRGGGYEYHIDSLPTEARIALLKKHLPHLYERRPSKPKKTSEQLWKAWNQVKDRDRDEATRRLYALNLAQDLIAAGTKRREAFEQAAAEYGTSFQTLYKWQQLVRGLERKDWLPVLLPRKRGKPAAKAECSPQAWEVFKADYLRLSKPTAQACYRRLQRVAEREGWTVPSLKTLMRRLEAEFSRPEIVFKREGREALMKCYPAQERDRSELHALQVVNADGHKFDNMVRWEDGTIGRPIMVAWQDVHSGKILSYRIGKSESSELVRLSYGDMVEKYGIPEVAILDNGRAFAAKEITGGVSNRYRFKVKDDEIPGLMVKMGTEPRWATPYHGQAKPVERLFRDVAGEYSKEPFLEGSYTGNRPDAKPENYGSRAIPVQDFLSQWDSYLAEANARPGRRGGVTEGRSFDQVFAESYATAPIRKATKEQRDLWLMKAIVVSSNRYDGSVRLHGNRYWCEGLSNYAGTKVALRYDPDNLKKPVRVYNLDGVFIAEADNVGKSGFLDEAAAKETARNRRNFTKLYAKAAEAKLKLSPDEVAELLPALEHAPVPTSKVVTPVFPKNTQADAVEDDDDALSADEQVVLDILAARQRLREAGGM